MGRRSRDPLVALLVAVLSLAGALAVPVAAADHVGATTADSGVIQRPPRRVVPGTLPTAPDPAHRSGAGRSGSAVGLRPIRPSGPAVGHTTAAADPGAASTTTAPALAEPESFDGLAWGSEDLLNAFSNPMVAVGPDDVIQVIDEVVSITDRNGNQEALVTVVDFFGLTAPGIPLSWGSDVQVVYDSLHARWLALEWSIDCSWSIGINTVGHGYIDLAISDTADPLQGWTIYSKGRNDRSPIRPALGTSTDKVVVSASWTQMMDPGSTPIGCGEGAADAREITAFSWSQLLAAGTATTKSFNLGLDTTDELSAEVDFWRPAVASPATSPTIFLVGRGGSAMDGYYATITGNPSGGTAAISAAVDLATANVVAPFSDVPFALEPTTGWTLQTEAGPTSVIWQSGHLAFVSGHHCAGDRACVRVTELGTGTTTPTRRQDLLIADAAADNFGGGIAYSGTGDLHVVWTHSSEAAGDFASTYAAYHRAGDPADSISARQLLASGTDTYASTVWTLRQGMAPDPQVPSAVWQGNIVSVGAEFYASYVSRLQPPGTTYVPITPLRILDSRIGTGLSGKFTSNTARTWQVAGVGGIPANAVAVTGNVTVTQQETAGFVSVTPTATNTPPSSTINFPLADNRANNLTVPLSSSGTLSAVFKGGTGKKTHLVFDVTGYFLADDTRRDVQSHHPDPGARFADRQRAGGQVRQRHAADPGHRRDPRHPADGDRRDRQPDGDPAVGGRLPDGDQDAAGHPADVDPQLPGRRQPGQRRVRAARRVGRAVDRVQGQRRRGDDPRRARYHGLLRAGHERAALRADEPESDDGHPEHGRPVGPARAVQRQRRPGPAGRRPLGRAGRHERGDRQPDRHRPDGRRLHRPVTDAAAAGAGHLDPQLQGRRQPGQRPRRAAERLG